MVLKFHVSHQVFKTVLKKLIDDYLKMKDLWLSLHCLKKLKLIKEICKENTSEFKSKKFILKFSLNLSVFS